MTMICPICSQDTQHDADASVVKCRHCLRSFQLEPKSMNTSIERATELTAVERAENNRNKAVVEAIAAAQPQRSEDEWEDDSPAAKAPQSPLVENYIRMFVQDILHGDDTHKAWLLEAAECFIEGRHIPPARSNTPALTTERQRDKWQRQAFDSRSELLSALAAIEKHNNSYYGGDHPIIDVDLSLLHEHDTEIWSELRDLLHLPSTDNDKSLVITEIKRLMEYERPALAKVKQ